MRFEVDSQLLFGGILVDIDGKRVVGNLADKASDIVVVDMSVFLLWHIFHRNSPHKKGWNIGIKDGRNKHGKGSAGIHQFFMRHVFGPVAGPSHVLNGYSVTDSYVMFLAKEVHLGKQVAESEVASCQSLAACEHQSFVQQLIDRSVNFGLYDT